MPSASPPEPVAAGHDVWFCAAGRAGGSTVTPDTASTDTVGTGDTDLALLQNTTGLLRYGDVFSIKTISPSLCSRSQRSLGNVSALNIACNYGLAVSESSITF